MALYREFKGISTGKLEHTCLDGTFVPRVLGLVENEILAPTSSSGAICLSHMSHYKTIILAPTHTAPFHIPSFSAILL